MYRIYAVEPTSGRRHSYVSEADWADTMDVFAGAPFVFALLSQSDHTTPQINGWYTALKTFEHVTPEVDRMLSFLKSAAHAGLSLQAAPHWSA